MNAGVVDWTWVTVGEATLAAAFGLWLTHPNTKTRVLKNENERWWWTVVVWCLAADAAITKASPLQVPGHLNPWILGGRIIFWVGAFIGITIAARVTFGLMKAD